MVETVIARSLRWAGPAAFALFAAVTPAGAQQPYPPTPAPTLGAPARNPACVRLEGQLATVDRGNQDPAKAEQIKRFEETASRQQQDLDRVSAQGRRMGCEGRGFFALFGGQPAQCGPINSQIQQLRGNLDRTLGELERLQGNTADREGQRRAVLAALAQNDCGPQYRAYATRSGGGGFFDALFGRDTIVSPDMPQGPMGDSYRTVCVRTCDGFYFPISYSATPSRFAEDEKVCQRLCPAAETVLYTHRNPGEDMTQAVSVSGRPYSELPTAFAYRKQLTPGCSCRQAGQTWADALKHLDDQTVERGDIIVTEERARQLSQPVDAQGRPIRPAVRPAAAPQTPEAAPPATTTEQKPEGEPGKRQIRTVGPTFYPVR